MINRDRPTTFDLVFLYTALAILVLCFGLLVVVGASQ